jgi:hypothetical protein
VTNHPFQNPIGVSRPAIASSKPQYGVW